jgi:hypothetical protein
MPRGPREAARPPRKRSESTRYFFFGGDLEGAEAGLAVVCGRDWGEAPARDPSDAACPREDSAVFDSLVPA